LHGAILPGSLKIADRSDVPVMARQLCVKVCPAGDATSTDGGEEVTTLLQLFRYSEPWWSLE
jgi:hypothetical protein